MLKDYQEQQRKQDTRMRSIADYTSGVIFLLFGSFFVFYEKLNIQVFNYQSWYKYIGILFMIYGAWRIYRGYKKNYYKE